MKKLIALIILVFAINAHAGSGEWTKSSWQKVNGVTDIPGPVSIDGDVSVSGDGTLLSSEYLQNGDFAVNGGANTTATGWTFTAAGGWNVGTNNMIYTHDADAADQILTQTSANMTIPVVAGKSYAFTYEIVAFSDADADGTLRPYIETTDGVVLSTDFYLEIAVATHTIYFQSPASGNLDFIIGVAGSEASDTFTIDNLSLVTTELDVNGQVMADNLIVNGNMMLGVGDGSSVGGMNPLPQYTINAYHYSDTRKEHRVMNLWNEDGSDHGFARGALITMEYSGTQTSTTRANLKGYTGELTISGGASAFPALSVGWGGYNSVRLKNSGIVTGNANLYGTGSELIHTSSAADGTYDSYYGFHSEAGTATGGSDLNITTMAGIGVLAFANFTGTQVTVAGGWFDKQTIGDTNNYGLVLNGDGVGADLVLGASQDSKLSNDATDNRINIDGEGLKVTGSDPVLSACGTTPAVVGNDMAGKITIGTGATQSCTVTFAAANDVAPACVISGDNNAIGYATTTSTTVLTITSSADMDSDVISYICIGL